jgi:F-type H+-transporting ATPase subunit delta
MRPTVSQYATALEELVSAGAEKGPAQIVENFLGLLRRRGETGKIQAILSRLEKMEADKERKILVTVVTAHEADTETKALLVKKIESLFPGKKAELRFEVDKNVIGGALFRTDEVLYDATLTASMKKLRADLVK